jgi:hypothetical protein
MDSDLIWEEFQSQAPHSIALVVCAYALTPERTVFDHLCDSIRESDDGQLMGWLLQNYDIRSTRDLCPLLAACEKGELNTVIRLHKYFKYTPSEAQYGDFMPFQIACKLGHIKMAQWLIRQYPLPAMLPDDIFYLVDFACNSSNLGILNWLLRRAAIPSKTLRDYIPWDYDYECKHKLKSVQLLVRRIGATVHNTDGIYSMLLVHTRQQLLKYRGEWVTCRFAV